ncbi:DUF4173 domain-containing protein [Flammeovirgaceae bacterium SG7u.132]|nr:DUF4173 domain-containing protein [Flammeovirgaceae bacterium SG7u.132]
MSFKLGITCALAAFGSYLFYNQGVGVNYFIFTLLSSLFALYNSKTKPLDRRLLAVLPPLTSALLLVFYPQGLTYAVWLISYLVMWSAVPLRLQPLLLPLQGIFSMVESPVFILKKYKNSEGFKSRGKAKKDRLFTYGITSLIVFGFTLLYSSGNPVFANLLSHIDLSYIDFGYFFTAVAIFILLIGLVFIKINEDVVGWNRKSTTLLFTKVTEKEKREFNIANLSIWIIAGVLCVVNTMDIVVLFGGKLPENMTYSEYVHQGFNILILSLSLAIGLIVYFFRNQLNFMENIQKLRLASYVWISQNIALAMLTAYKNMIYVEVYGLTYKRVAVFLCLACTLIGLLLSFRKIKIPSTNWLYFNRVAFYAFICSVVISIVPFDHIITEYNLKYSQTKDIAYLLKLNHADLKEVKRYLEKSGQKYTVLYYKSEAKILELNEQAKEGKWQSWNMYLSSYLKD